MVARSTEIGALRSIRSEDHNANIIGNNTVPDAGICFCEHHEYRYVGQPGNHNSTLRVRSSRVYGKAQMAYSDSPSVLTVCTKFVFATVPNSSRLVGGCLSSRWFGNGPVDTNALLASLGAAIPPNMPFYSGTTIIISSMIRNVDLMSRDCEIKGIDSVVMTGDSSEDREVQDITSVMMIEPLIR